MKLNLIENYIPAIEQNKRYYLICGGRAGGRSYFASQYATASLLTKGYFRCAIMRYVQGDIRNSIFQEIIDRLEELEFSNTVNINENGLKLEYANNKINGIGFRKSSSDQKAKLKSLAGYTDVIIEEAEEVCEEDFNQLDDSLRTIKANIRIILLFNLPPKEHWICKRWFNLIDSGVEGFYEPKLKTDMEETTCLVHTTYLDNIEHLNQTTIENFKRYLQTNPEHYWNMIMGLVPSGARGRIFKDWQPISQKEYDELDYPVYYGGDFGFSNDPTAFVEVKEHNDNIYVKELLYQTGLINKRIADKLEQMSIDRTVEQYWDSAEMKSIEDLKQLDWNTKPASKGAGSRKAGVDMLLGKNIYYVEGSDNLVKEMQGYCWALDKNKNPTNEPDDGNDHLLDALRYAVYTRNQ